MEVSSVNQAYVFLSMILCGGICTAVFDVFRAVRRYKKSDGGVIVLQDLVFWIVELCLVYLTAFKLNYAKVRVYEILALVIGSVIYFVTLSDFVIKQLCMVIGAFVTLINKISVPFRKLAKTLMLPAKKLRKYACEKSEIVRTAIRLRVNIAGQRMKKAFKVAFSSKKNKSVENNKTTV